MFNFKRGDTIEVPINYNKIVDMKMRFFTKEYEDFQERENENNKQNKENEENQGKETDSNFNDDAEEYNDIDSSKNDKEEEKIIGDDDFYEVEESQNKCKFNNEEKEIKENTIQQPERFSKEEADKIKKTMKMISIKPPHWAEKISSEDLINLLRKKCN